MIRDTATYRPFKPGRKTPSLKSLASKYLDLTIQTGEHNSVEDAQAAFKLYLKYRKEWENKLRTRSKLIPAGTKLNSANKKTKSPITRSSC